tara:strand:+ start:152 stop:397 length:246 start_codon:yes stop_codon:yes gene_type:complete
MFGFMRSVMRPFASLGSKMGEFFGIGRKVARASSDLRNLEAFEDLAPSGLRSRFPAPEMRAPDGSYYGNMEGYLSNFKYPN